MRFSRTWRLVFGQAGRKGLELLPPLRMSFEVTKDTEEEPNKHRISVWNLKPETRDALTKPDTFVVLYAGYEHDNGALLLASGNVIYGYTRREGPDIITEIEVADGFVNLRDSAVSVGYAENVSAKTILTDLAGKMGLTLYMPSGAPDRTWSNGFSFYGPAHQALHKVVQGTGLEWSIQNGTLQVLERNGVTQRRAIVLAAGAGLIGSPERTRDGAREKAVVKDQKTGNNKNIASSEQMKEGWRVRSMLLPQAMPGDVIKLETEFVEGFFRIESLKSTGDYSGGGDWQTELQLVDSDGYKIAQAKAQKKKADAESKAVKKKKAK